MVETCINYCTKLKPCKVLKWISSKYIATWLDVISTWIRYVNITVVYNRVKTSVKRIKFTFYISHICFKRVFWYFKWKLYYKRIWPRIFFLEHSKKILKLHKAKVKMYNCQYMSVCALISAAHFTKLLEVKYFQLRIIFYSWCQKVFTI